MSSGSLQIALYFQNSSCLNPMQCPTVLPANTPRIAEISTFEHPSFYKESHETKQSP